MRDRLSLFFFLSKYCFSGSCFIWWQIKGGWVRHCIRGFKQKNALNVVEGEKKKNRWNASVIEICKKKSQFFCGGLSPFEGLWNVEQSLKKKKRWGKVFFFYAFSFTLGNMAKWSFTLLVISFSRKWGPSFCFQIVYTSELHQKLLNSNKSLTFPPPLFSPLCFTFPLFFFKTCNKWDRSSHLSPFVFFLRQKAKNVG